MSIFAGLVELVAVRSRSPTVDGVFSFRLLRPADLASIPADAIGAVIDHYHPGGLEWLRRRLPLAAQASASHAHVALDGDRIVGLLLVVPKGARVKLACLWVDPAVRRRRVAATLLERAVAPYPDLGVFLTAPSASRDAFEPLMAHAGFSLVGVASDRYGPGRDELVFSRAAAAAPDVRALSLARPWPDLVFDAGKHVENRSWTTRWRGLVVIHAARSWRSDAAGWCAAAGLPAPPESRGPAGFVGIARLVAVDCHAHSCAGVCSPWAMDSSWHWRLVSAYRFRSPVDAGGNLGLWRPPADVAAAALEFARALPPG